MSNRWELIWPIVGLQAKLMKIDCAGVVSPNVERFNHRHVRKNVKCGGSIVPTIAKSLHRQSGTASRCQGRVLATLRRQVSGCRIPLQDIDVDGRSR